MSLSIRRATRGDEELLSQLCASTFLKTYIPARPSLEKEFINYTKRNYSKESIKEKLLDPGIIYLIAEINDIAVGYCKISLRKSHVGKTDKKWTQLEEVYVIQGNQGQGVGKKIMEEFQRIAKKEGNKTTWLGVWDGNKKAIAFYKKQGFEVFGSQEFKIDTTTDTDLLMKKDVS